VSPGTGSGTVPDDLVLMAHVKEPFGLKGWVRLHDYSGDDVGLAGFKEWWLDRGTESAPNWQAVKPEEIGEHGGGLNVKLPGVADRDAALALKGKRIAVSRSQFPESGADDGYYWSDLIGLVVRNRQDEVLGVVDGLLDLGPHEVLQVKAAVEGEAKAEEILIPFVAQYIDEVDVAGKVIKVDWGKDY